MAIDKVRAYFRELGLEDRILEFDKSSETVSLAALAVGTEPNNIVKTMSFKVDGDPILICLAGEARISNPKFKATFHQKASMIPFEEVGELIGHDVGGVCPFAVNPGVRVYLDKSLEALDVAYPAAGSGNSAVRLTVPELEKYASPCQWVDVSKDPE